MRRRRGCSRRRSGSRRVPAARSAVDCWFAPIPATSSSRGCAAAFVREQQSLATVVTSKWWLLPWTEPVAPRRPPASLLRLAEQAPATVESALMQLVRSEHVVSRATGYRSHRRSSLAIRANEGTCLRGRDTWRVLEAGAATRSDQAS